MPMVFLFCAYFYVLRMGDIRATYVEACGLWWEHKHRAIIEAVSNLVLNVVLCRFYGVYGVIIATLLTLFIINFGFGSRTLFKYYFTEQPLSQYFVQHFFYMSITAIACILTYLLCASIEGSPWMVLIARALICCVAPNIIYLAVYSRYKLGRESVKWLKHTFLKRSSSDEGISKDE